MTDDLVTWLRAQIDDDERGLAPLKQWAKLGYDGTEGRLTSSLVAVMSARRALAEVDAKRRILDAYVDAVRMHRLMSETDDDGKWDWLFKSEALEGVAKLLALPYADRPGYQDEWRPQPWSMT